jgi:hypothetical protein
MFGVMRAYTDALTAVDTEFTVNLCFFISDPDRLGGAALNAVNTAHAEILIKSYRMIKFIQWLTSF